MPRIEEMERRLDDIARRLRAGVEDLVINIAEEIGREIVPRTPVKTGFARGNWRPSLNAPATVPVSVLDPTGAATVARIAAVAKQYKIGGTFFIVNRAPYIGSLNLGGSPQAGPGFVQAAIEEGTRRGVARFSDGVIG